MKRVMSIDLGVTTGWCVRNTVTDEVVAHGTIEYPDPMRGNPVDILGRGFRHLVERYLPSYVVVEAPIIDNVRGELGGKLANLIAAAKAVFRNRTEWITPSQWKQRYGTHPLPDSFKNTDAHQRDAFRILEWWLKTRMHLVNMDVA